MSIAAEAVRPGGAKDLAEMIYLGKDSDMFGK
jgi:hypothetical protein